MKPPFQLAAPLMLCLAGAPAVAAPPRAATGKWVLDFAEDKCLATRHYGSADEPLVLAFKPSPTGELMQIALVIKGQSFREPREAPATIRIDGHPPIRSDLLSFGVKQKGLRSIRINLPIATFAPMRQATNVAIKSYGEIEESFALGQMNALMTEMDRCLADLREYWNVAEAAQAKLQSRATANLASFFTDADYPLLAASKRKGGTTKFVLLVDQAGKVADCTITATSNVPALDSQACALIVDRAKFAPAVGADGKPARDAVVSSIRWVIPQRSNARPRGKEAAPQPTKNVL